MGKNKTAEQAVALAELMEPRSEPPVIGDVLGVVKSGKEATVYLCEDPNGDGLLAAKVYRSTDTRRFADDSMYREGRLRRKNRHARAIEQKSRAGREFAFAAWVSAEYEALGTLFASGCDVPRPVHSSGTIIVMQYIGDEDEPAPPLSNIRLAPEEARPIFDRIMRNVELMLSCDLVHGDLSPYNILYLDQHVGHSGSICIIDFPQAVDARFNSNALALLERDIANVCAYFARYGIDADPHRITHSLWVRFLRSDL